MGPVLGVVRGSCRDARLQETPIWPAGRAGARCQREYRQQSCTGAQLTHPGRWRFLASLVCLRSFALPIILLIGGESTGKLSARFLELFGLPSRLCLFSPSLLFLWELATVQLDFQKTSVWARHWTPGYPHTIGATRCVFWHQGWKGGPLSRVRTPTCLHDACSGRTGLAPRPVHPLCLHEVTAASPAVACGTTAFPLRLWTGAESARSADWLGLRHIIYCVVQEGRARITPRDAHLPRWSWSRCASGSPAPCYHLLLVESSFWDCQF